MLVNSVPKVISSGLDSIYVSKTNNIKNLHGSASTKANIAQNLTTFL